MKSRIVVAGIGETGSDLARRLCSNWSVVCIDNDAAALEGLREACEDTANLAFHAGDATSALVLRRAELERVHAVVACTGSDEVNAEVLRVARDSFQVENLVALMHSLEWEEHHRREGFQLVSQDRACAALLESRVERGQKVATGVGLGHGEIVEVTVLPNSSVVGHSLAELGPRRWLVGAVYRNGELIVPHGDTVIESGDHVVIIGDPEVLPSIATLIRSGDSEFPMQFGTHVVSVCSDRVNSLVDEVKYLLATTRADRFEVVACDAEEARLRSLARRCEQAGIPFEFSCSAVDTTRSLAEEASRRDVGLLILPPEPLKLLSRLGLGRSRTAEYIDRSTSPVLISRDSFPYSRVLLVLAELPFSPAAAQAAIDVVRMVGGELFLGVVHQPELVAGADLRQEVEKRRQEIESIAGMYHVDIRTVVFEGNPIVEIEKASGDYDLMVLPFRRGHKAFLTRPDVALNLLHRARCSVMVMPR